MHTGRRLADTRDNTTIIKSKDQAHRVTTTTRTLQDIRFRSRASSTRKTTTPTAMTQSQQATNLSTTGMVEIAARAITESQIINFQKQIKKINKENDFISAFYYCAIKHEPKLNLYPLLKDC
jgi:hypothetical protein